MEHVYAVTSMSELKQVMPASGGVVQLLGYRRAGDGGGGMFHWNAESTAQPDDGMVVAASKKSQRGRWHRVESSPIDVRWFGAVGQSSDETRRMQRALDAARNGGTVHIPAGTYNVTKPLRIYQGTSLIGDGLLSLLRYTGPAKTGCLQSATPGKSCAFHIARLNLEVLSEKAWGIDLRGMSFSRFDHVTIHLRKSETSGYFGPGDGQSPYYNVFTACHVAGPGKSDTNGCVAFNFTYDEKTRRQAPNANQVLGGHINSCQIAVACYGTGNVFYAQVLEDCKDGYVLGLPIDRLSDPSKGTINCITGCYTEYVQRVIVQLHESCTATAELTHTTGYKEIFAGDTTNSVVLTGHDGRLKVSRSFVHREIDVRS